MSEPEQEYGWTPSGITPTTSGITRSPILENCAAYGCRVNEIEIDDLFNKYQELDFLYPAKLKTLAPYMSEVKDNWRRMVQAGDQLIRIVDASGHGAGNEGWASITGWRSTHGCWNWQHLISAGHPMYPRAVMLGSNAEVINDDLFQSFENWFRPDNRFPARVFGTLLRTVGESLAMANTYDYVAFPITTANRRELVTIVEVKPTDTERVEHLRDLAVSTKGSVYVKAEELDGDDLLLDSVDQLYSKVGLRRYRRIWLAYAPNSEEPIAGAIAYRGPLGLNFSFLENRCDLLVANEIAPDQFADATADLMNAAAAAYDDFSPKTIPVVSPAVATPILVNNGASVLRQYTHSAWLRDGLVPYYRHLEAVYVRLLRAYDRRGKLDRSLVPKPTATTDNASKDQSS